MAKAEDFAKRFNAIPQNASLGYISDQNCSFDSSMSYFNQILFKFISIRSYTSSEWSSGAASISCLVKNIRHICNLVLPLKLCQKSSVSYFSKLFIIVLCLIALCSTLVSGSTCSSLTGGFYAIEQYQDSFSDKSATQSYAIVSGPVSGDIYYIYKVQTPVGFVIKRYISDVTLSWTASFEILPVGKSIKIDSNEQYIYIGGYTYPLQVIRLQASTGALVDQVSFPGVSGKMFDFSIHVKSDSSGYFIVGMYSTTTAMCQFTFLSPSTAACYEIPNHANGAYGQAMISDTELFLLGINPTSKNLHAYKVSFSTGSVNWANSITCSSGTCSIGMSYSVTNSDNLLIYSFFPYGLTSSSLYLHFITFAASDGSIVGSRYKSSVVLDGVYGLTKFGDYIIPAISSGTSYYLMIYNTASSTFIYKKMSAYYIYGVAYETQTGRVIIVGENGSIGYTSKFLLDYINLHPKMSNAPWIMKILSAGTDDIYLDGEQAITSITDLTMSAPSYSNVSSLYIKTAISGGNSDVYLASTTTQTFSVASSSKSQVSPSVACSVSGSTSITYSIADYSGTTYPSWVTVSSSKGQLAIFAPTISATTSYSFYVDSTVSGITNPAHSLVAITVTVSCNVLNCQTCSSSSVCAICNAGYTLSSGSCSTSSGSGSSSGSSSRNQSGTTAAINLNSGLKDTSYGEKKALITLVCISIGTISLLSIANVTSTVFMWSLINQIQLFFLLLLTRAFIPDAVQAVIIEPNFAMNPFESISFLSSVNYGLLTEDFKFSVSSSSMSSFNYGSISTYYNTFSCFISFLYAAFLHIVVIALCKICNNLNEEGKCRRVVKAFKIILTKVFEILTFGYYIRLILEVNQFFLVSSISEVHNFNTSQPQLVFSIFVAILIIIISVSLICFTAYLSLSSYELDEDKHNKLGEFFNGLKSMKRYRLYCSILMTRRLIFIVLLTTFMFVSSQALIGILTAIQVPYIIYFVMFKAYEETKDNVIEIINELVFLVLLGSLIIFNSESDWSITVTYIYMTIIFLNTVINFIVIHIFLVRAILLCVKSKFSKSAKIKQTKDLEQMQSAEDLIERERGPETHRELVNEVTVIEEIKEENKDEIEENTIIQDNDDKIISEEIEDKIALQEIEEQIDLQDIEDQIDLQEIENQIAIQKTQQGFKD